MSPLLSLSLSLFFLCLSHFSPSILCSPVSPLFSSSYSEADEKFQLACESVPHAILDTKCLAALGAQGEQLCTRACIFGPADSSTVLFALSGVHGAEAFGPVTVQLAIIMDTAAGGEFALPRGVRGVFIHIVEPWGTSWGFKENENNVDMLKNINGVYKVKEENKILDEFIVGLNISYFNLPEVQQAAMGLQGALVARYGGDAVQAAFQFGQGDIAAGIVYYGQEEQTQAANVRLWAAQWLAGAQHVVLLDLHSAAGPYGEWLLAAYDAASSAIGQQWLDGAAVNRTMEPLAEAGVGFKPWPYYESITEALAPNTQFIRLLWEAGTFPQSEYAGALILGIYCRYYYKQSIMDGQNINADASAVPQSLDNPLLSPYCTAIRSEIAHYFYPNEAAWQRAILADMSGPMKALMYGLGTLSGGQRGKDRMSKAAMAGLAIGGLAVLIIVCFLVYRWLKARRQNSRGPAHDGVGLPESYYSLNSNLVM